MDKAFDLFRRAQKLPDQNRSKIEDTLSEILHRISLAVSKIAD
jgi:hypothetical protein